LAEGDRREITPLRPAAACVELVRHSYRAALLSATNGVARHLRRCAAVARGVAVRRVARPLDLSALPALAAAVEEDLAQVEHGLPGERPST
jgi:hypothetical protein